MSARINAKRRSFECVLHNIWIVAREQSYLDEPIRWESAVDMLYGLRLIMAAEGREQEVEDCNLLTGIALRHAQNARLALKAAA